MVSSGLVLVLAGVLVITWTVRKGSDGRTLVDLILGDNAPASDAGAAVGSGSPPQARKGGAAQPTGRYTHDVGITRSRGGRTTTNRRPVTGGRTRPLAR